MSEDLSPEPDVRKVKFTLLHQMTELVDACNAFKLHDELLQPNPSAWPKGSMRPSSSRICA
jgi:hypothetical protein